jgi:hypothetical protein
MKNTKIVGIVLIVLGLLIVIHNLGIHIFSWQFIRSIGFLLIGILLLLKGFEKTPRRNLYIGSWFAIIGAYFLLGELQFYHLSAALSLTVFTLTFGLSFYILFLFKNRDWGYLIYGNLILLIGIFFLLEYLLLLPPFFFEDTIDQYWPLILIVLGLIIFFRGFFTKNLDKTKLKKGKI